MAIKLTDLETGANKVRTGAHAFGTAHPFTFGAIVLVICQVAGHFGIHL